MTNNVKFNYLYRDAGNYKSWGTTVFANPDGLLINDVESRPRKSFFYRELFVARQIGIPEVFLYTTDAATEDDHCFHEFESIELTNEAPNDVHKRTLKDFVAEVEKESAKSWHTFSPQRWVKVKARAV